MTDTDGHGTLIQSWQSKDYNVESLNLLPEQERDIYMDLLLLVAQEEITKSVLILLEVVGSVLAQDV